MKAFCVALWEPWRAHAQDKKYRDGFLRLVGSANSMEQYYHHAEKNATREKIKLSLVVTNLKIAVTTNSGDVAALQAEMDQVRRRVVGLEQTQVDIRTELERIKTFVRILSRTKAEQHTNTMIAGCDLRTVDQVGRVRDILDDIEEHREEQHEITTFGLEAELAGEVVECADETPDTALATATATAAAMKQAMKLCGMSEASLEQAVEARRVAAKGQAPVVAQKSPPTQRAWLGSSQTASYQRVSLLA